MTKIDIPKNAAALVKAAERNGWSVRVTEGRGTVEVGRGESKRTAPASSVAVRLSNDAGVRAFGVWVSTDGETWKFTDGAAIRPAPRGGHIFALLGYRELSAVVGRPDVPKPSAGR